MPPLPTSVGAGHRGASWRKSGWSQFVRTSDSRFD